jgi:hypothetical protein
MACTAAPAGHDYGLGRGAAEEGADKAANYVAGEEDVVDRIEKESGVAGDAF